MITSEILYFAWVGKTIMIVLALAVIAMFAISIANYIGERIEEKKAKTIPAKKDDEFFFGEVQLANGEIIPKR